MTVIITCGAAKCITRSKAKDLYIGTHFKKCLMWARTKAKDDKIFILSAKYGLMPLDKKIDPYDLKMGQAGSVKANVVEAQAKDLGILNDDILSTAGLKYRQVLDRVFHNIKYPFEGLSMGYMGQEIKRQLKGIK